MQPISKLNLNPNRYAIPNGAMVDARNIVATTDQKAVHNEQGFSKIYESYGTVNGKIETPEGFVSFYTAPDKIVYIKNDQVIKEINSPYFNFSLNNPITGSYSFNSDEDLIITFTEGVDGANETRIINITQSNTVLTKDETLNLNLIPNVVYPKISRDVIVGGSLLIGSYQICISYLVTFGTYTNNSILYPVTDVKGDINNHSKIGTSSNRCIKYTIDNLDTKYEKYRIGVLYKGEDEFEKVYYTEDIDINTSTYTLYNLDSLLSGSIDDLTIGGISYIKDNSHASFQGRLIRGNVKTINYTIGSTKLDDVMNNLASKVAVKFLMYTPSDVFQWNNIGVSQKHFKAGEQYAIFIGAIDYKGNLVNAYPILHKDGDDTEVAYTNSDRNVAIHKIPYLEDNLSGFKTVVRLKMVLPDNVDELLGEFSNTIASFCYFYAEHNLNNSKVLGQGYVIRDTNRNDFAEQKYWHPFHSATKLRFYSFEHLFNKSVLSNASLYNHTKLPDFEDAEYRSNVVLEGYGNYCKVYSRSDSILRNRVNFPISKIDYVPNDNTVSDNIAGDSFHRLTMSADDTDTLFGSDSADRPSETQYTPTTYFLSSTTVFNQGNNRGSTKIAAIADLISNNDYFYDDLYKQTLIICSSIIGKTDLETYLEGDFFYNNLTLRATTPGQQYQYGTENVDAQGEDYVHKVIISINLESRYNLAARYNGVNEYQKVFNISSETSKDLDVFIDIPYVNDNFINTDEGKGYSNNLNYPGYNYNLYVKELDLKYHFPNRVIRSVVDSTESRGTPWRLYKANDYKDFPIYRGPINGIESDANTVYVQQAFSLSVATVRDKLSTSDSGESYLGSSDLFDREPIEVMFDKTGYIGCNNRFSFIITSCGYVVVDSTRKNIFLVRVTEATKLNTLDVEYFFDNNIGETLVNPYKKAGIALMYDDKVKSLFLTNQSSENVGYTIHYNFPRQGWLSFHDYIPDMYIANRISSYCIKNSKIYKRYASSKAIFFDSTPAKSSITFNYAPEPDIFKQMLAIMWDTTVKVDYTLLYDKTFDVLLAYNDTQCSGEINLNDNEDWFDTESGVTKKDVWYLNNFFDIVVNDKRPFMDANGNLITSNLDVNRDWFDKSYFISKYLFLKLVYNNNFININTGQVSTIPVEGYSQADITLNAWDVNAVKSIR